MPGRKPMKTILAAIEFNDAAEQVLRMSTRVARAFDATVYLLHVEPPTPDSIGYDPGPRHLHGRPPPDIMQHYRQLEAFRDHLREAGIDAHGLLIEGPTVQKVLGEARRLEVELIIVGSHGHGPLYELFWGSVSEGIVRRAHCPVLVVPCPGT